jgi:hypothetical protein
MLLLHAVLFAGLVPKDPGFYYICISYHMMAEFIRDMNTSV